MGPDVAYQIIHDELMLDGNSRQNLATFCTTWIEPQVRQLMSDSVDKNMIDKDEYPQTAEIESRCVHILSGPVELSRSGNYHRLLHYRLQRSGDAGWTCDEMALAQRRRQSAGKTGDRPNLVCGHGASLLGKVRPVLRCRDYVRFRFGGPQVRHDADEAGSVCDENTIGVVAILGSPSMAPTSRLRRSARSSTRFEKLTGIDIPVHVDGAAGAFVAPFIDPKLEWDFRLPRVASINASGHKYGLVYPGVGWIIWRDSEALTRRSHLLG